MYNLQPTIGEVNQLRKNFKMSIISEEKRIFGKCDVEIKNNNIQVRSICADYFMVSPLFEEEPEIFKAMKKTITSYIERDVVGNMNPAHGYLHGDNEQGGVEIGSPWLDGGYELNNPPSTVTSFFIFLWILVQAFKYQLAAAFIFVVLIFYAFKKLRQ